MAELALNLDGLAARAQKLADTLEAARKPATNRIEFTERELATPANIGHVLKVHENLVERCRKLEARILEFEKRAVLEDGGTWQERAPYRPGQVVTYKGSAWVCREANSNTRPGKSDCWRLMVKSDQR